MNKKIKCSIEEHHAHPSIGSSLTKILVEQSPAHYLYTKENRQAPTPVQAFGNAIHQAVLEPALFKKNMIAEPVFAGTGSRLAKEQWHLEHHGKTILKADQPEVIEGILKSISKHKQASKLISDGAAEESIFWTDETGVECKARPDFLREGHILVDIKSTQDASRQAFKKDIGNYLYHVQAALYLDGATAVFGQEFDKFIIIACEKTAPYAVNCFSLGQETIEEGRALYKQALKVLKKCQLANHYPAYDDSEIIPIGLNSYHFRTE